MFIFNNTKNKNLVIIAGILAFLALGIVSFILSRSKPQLEPIKIYKSVTPGPKPIPTETNMERTEIATPHWRDQGHSHDHSHNTDLPSPSGNDYDWQDDSAFDTALTKGDPWKQIYPKGKSTDDADDTYPPRDWYKTEDPGLFIQYFQDQLIKQFGDIPQVYTIVEMERKTRLGVPIKNVDEYTDFLKAQYHLWPDETTLHTLKDLQKAMRDGIKIVFTANPPENPKNEEMK